MALADCMSGYAREMLLRMTCWNEVPHHESPSIGYQWTPTQFVHVLHSTAPGEAGDLTTNETTYAGYARTTTARGASAWTLSGTGTAAPIMRPAAVVAWPDKTNAGSATCDAHSIGIRNGASDVAMCYDVPSTPATFIQDQHVELGVGQVELRVT